MHSAYTRRFFRARECNDTAARQKCDEKPEGGGVGAIPQGFLGSGDTRRAENDERARGARVHKLAKEDAASIGIEPSDEHAHGGHRGGEGGEKRKPKGAVRGRRSQEIYNRQVPEAPQKTEQYGRVQSREFLTHLREGETHSADLFKKARGNSECEADKKTVWRVNRGDQGFQTQENGENHGWRNQESRVPVQWKANAAHAREQVTHSVGTVEKPPQNDAHCARAKQHGWKHEDTGQFREGLPVQKMRCRHEQSARPGDRERQSKVGCDRMAPNKRFAC